MPPEGIFSLKSQVILRRTTSRDLFDLWTFLERGWTIEQILSEARNEDRHCSYEHLRRRLLPSRLPKFDPGLASLVDDGPRDIESVKGALGIHLDAYEKNIAMQIALDEDDDTLTP